MFMNSRRACYLVYRVFDQFLGRLEKRLALSKAHQFYCQKYVEPILCFWIGQTWYVLGKTIFDCLGTLGMGSNLISSLLWWLEANFANDLTSFNIFFNFYIILLYLAIPTYVQHKIKPNFSILVSLLVSCKSCRLRGREKIFMALMHF